MRGEKKRKSRNGFCLKKNQRKQFVFVFFSKDGQTVWPRLSIFRTVDTRNRADPFRILSFRHWYSSSSPSASRILCAVFILRLLSASWIWRLIRLYWTDFYGSCVWPPSSPISLPTWWDFLLQLAKTYQQKLHSTIDNSRQAGTLKQQKLLCLYC